MALLQKDERLLWVDVLKGIGIVTVVGGHIGGILPPEFGLMRMPLFLFVAGFLFKVQADQKEYLFKKFVHLLVPYICFLFLLYTPQAFMSVYHGHESVLQALEKGILGGPLLEGRAGVFWFVTCLFATQQLLNYLLNACSEKKVMGIMAILLGLSYVNSELYPEFWLPWSLNGVLAAAPIFFLGYMFRKYPVNLKGFEFLLLLVVIYVCTRIPNNLYNIKANNYGIPLVSFVSALIVLMCLITVARYLVRFRISTTFFGNISKGSMIIMYLHQSLQFLLKGIFVRDNPYLILGIVICTCLVIYQLIKRSMYARALLLGSVPDFKNLRVRIGQRTAIEEPASQIKPY
jgi:fucose 4-O-acetylase-like acetyltransferase